jgi:hypothetical protein
MIYGAVLALALVALWVGDRPGGRAAAPPAERQAAPGRTGAESAAARVPEVALERLAGRAQRGAEGDLFNGLATEEARRGAPPPVPAAPPQAPPLPFSYLGKLIDAERITVFLFNGNRTWAVGSGDTIDGAYRVDAIGDRTMTLTYLALGIRQELEIGGAPGQVQSVAGPPMSDALPVAVSAPSGVPLPGQVPLLLAAPSRVALGNELIVNVGVSPGRAVRDARVELAYDPKVLAAVGAPAGGAGRVSIALGGAAGPLAQVRFRVIAQSPTNTRIGIASATATDARGANVAFATPEAHGVAIVPRSRAN